MNASGITVWAEIWSARSYLEKLNKEVVPVIEYRMNSTEIFYMHDGAPAHCAQSVRDFLDNKFHNEWIGRRRPID